MSTFKITSVTNLLGKRENKYNSTLNIKYLDGMTIKTVNISAGDTVFLTIHSLPPSIQRLKIKKLINVIQVDEMEINNAINKTKVVIVNKPIEVDVIKNVEKKIEKRKVHKTGEIEIDS